jgi:hypothetical protein
LVPTGDDPPLARLGPCTLQEGCAGILGRCVIQQRGRVAFAPRGCSKRQPFGNRPGRGGAGPDRLHRRTPPCRLTRPVPGAAGDDDGRSVSGSFGDLDANLDRVLDVETVRPLVAALPDVNEPCSCFDSSRQNPDPDRRTARDLPDARLAPPGSISRRIARTSSDTNTGMSRLV